jgi:hypothetical protein
MAGLTDQTVASSYDQLLIVDNATGGDGTNLVAVKDGDGGTTFPIVLATDRVGIGCTTVPNATDGQPVALRVMGHVDQNSYTPVGAYTSLLVDYEIEVHNAGDANITMASNHGTSAIQTIWKQTLVTSTGSGSTASQRLRWRVSDWDGSNGQEVLTLAGYNETGTALRGNVGIGDSTPTYKLTLVGSSYQLGIPRMGLTSVTISSGTLAILSTQGPIFSVIGEGSTSDTLDSITVDGGTPEDGMMIWLTKGTGTITMGTAHASEPGTDNGIRCITNVGANVGFGSNLDIDQVQTADLGNSYAFLCLIYRAGSINKWLIQNAEVLSNVTA